MQLNLVLMPRDNLAKKAFGIEFSLNDFAVSLGNTPRATRQALTVTPQKTNAYKAANLRLSTVKRSW